MIAVPVSWVAAAVAVAAVWAWLYRRGILVTVFWWWVDGDTIRTLGPRIRIAGIEAPKKHSFHGRLSCWRMHLWLPVPGWPIVIVRTGRSHGRWVGRVYQPLPVGVLQRATGGAVRWDYGRDRRNPLRGWRKWTHGKPG